jgi:hypothetical protein
LGEKGITLDDAYEQSQPISRKLGIVPEESRNMYSPGALTRLVFRAIMF